MGHLGCFVRVVVEGMWAAMMFVKGVSCKISCESCY